MQPYPSKDLIKTKYTKGDYNSLVIMNADLKNQMMETKRREVTYE